ncbi:Rossmann-like and DUF2520 domain-containing protein [Microbacterium suaedae]|uniref:Rossmann-like and DUF2520 domain-containing protein n=1 Tax=Microbacterium suaedae TaxID=2067813 RepID=UPI000DA123DA|nr:DUF2520 domain-containing protein [Microbacterium suaedae]
MRREGRLGVGIVGAGRVGPVLGAALAGAGHQILGITSGADDERAAAVLPGVPVLEAPEVLRRSELVIVAVPRDVVADVVRGLAEAGHWQMGQLVLHVDAAHGIDVLRPAAEKGAIPLAVHPAMSFTGTSMDLRQLAATYAAVTAPSPVLPIAQALAVEMGCEPVVIDESGRAAYAEAIETATGFSRQIVQQSTGLLRGIGVENPGGFLSSLVRSTVDEALAEATPAIPDIPPELDV